jgi:hypothetical protein
LPIIDLELPNLGQSAAVPEGYVAPGTVDVEHGSDAPVERPAWSSTFAAAFRNDNSVGSYIADETKNSPIYREDGFNPWDVIRGTKYEPRFASFADVRNTRAADDVKRQIDMEVEDHKTLDAAPWYQSLSSRIIAGVADVPTLMPGGAFVRSANGGLSMVRSAAEIGLMSGVSAATQEAALHATQETRTGKESAATIGFSVFLGGLLGAGGAKLLSAGEWSSAIKALDADLARVGERPVGIPAAAGAAPNLPATLEQNSVAGSMAGAVASATQRLNPALRILESPAPSTREIGTQLFENSVYLKKNFDGVASEPAVETLAKEWNGPLATAVRTMNQAHPEYVKAGGTLNFEEFRQAVGKAMRRGDEDANPIVAGIAKEWRSKVFDPLKDAAIDAKLLPPDVSVETAQSYFSRMWNRNRLISKEGEFKNVVRNWVDESSPKWAQEFDKETIEQSARLKDDALAEFQTARRIERQSRFEGSDFSRGIADEVFNTLTGKTGDGVRPEFITIKARGPLKERTFAIPDKLVEDFLESDVDLVGRRYTRVMGADVELARKFGSPDMAEQVQKIRDDYARLRSEITDEKALRAMDKREKADVRDITALRDQLRGTRNISPIEQNFDRIVRSANHFNYLTSMGEVVLASVTDAVRPAMVHGLSAYMGGLAQLATNMKAVRVSVKEAQLAGNVAERVLSHRMATLTDIMDPYSSRGPIEAFLEKMTDTASKWNGIRLWTDGMKSFAAVLTQNRILKGVENFGQVKPSERAYLAFLGIDESMAGRIQKQFAAHGENLEGVRVAHTEDWTDPVAVRTYRAAMNKDVDSVIIQKSVADVPLFASTPVGKAMLQFKSFTLASHQKVLLRGLQEDQARFVGGTVAMTLMGMFITYMKALSGNRPEIQDKAINNPGWWIGEGLDRSGIFAVPMELSNAFEKASGFNLIKSPMKISDRENSMSQKNQNRSLIGSIAGPTAGLVDNVATTLGVPATMLRGEEITKGQKSAGERVFPFNSYPGFRQIIRYLVNPPER